jgi:thiosulfate/3-mercaptopyruvate sulfurtransferase
VFRLNLAADGAFKPADTLRSEWLALMAGHAPEALVMQCGSGVTACHNLLALQVAGLAGARIYPGSWSEWCAQPGAPIATGD